MANQFFHFEVYQNRRKELKNQMNSGIVLFLGNSDQPRNFKDNIYHFRQDSSFLYYFGINLPGFAAIIDLDADQETIFGTPLTIDDIVWMGRQPSIDDLCNSVGVKQWEYFKNLESFISKAITSKRDIHFLPPYRHENIIKLGQWLQIPTQDIQNHVSIPLIKTVVKQRSKKSVEEIAEMDMICRLSTDMHLKAMEYAEVGMMEHEVLGEVYKFANINGLEMSYQPILTVRGETLHNHHYHNELKNGDLLLFDGGLESKLGYAGDLTTTFPVNGKFDSRQKEVFEIVSKAYGTCVDMLKPGTLFKEVYDQACIQIFDGLKAMGITKGDPYEAVSVGAHAMFFQCGLGHMIGLDVHDMEDIGEAYVGYDHTCIRSKQFGAKSLRLGKKLEEGFCITVEPGVYFIPTLIDLWRSESKYMDFIHYNKLEEFKGFGGIRLEEDFLITSQGYRLLGTPIPKSVHEVEKICN